MPRVLLQKFRDTRHLVGMVLQEYEWLLWSRRDGGSGGKRNWVQCVIPCGHTSNPDCDKTDHEADTWAYFETKFYYGDTNSYLWHKLNVFSRWIPSTETTTLIVFDPPAPIKQKLPSPLIKIPTHGRLRDPFWIYEGLLEEILHLQDQSVWMIRDQVRATEKNRARVTRPNPDYGHLHEIARHAIHVSESLDATVKTVESILQRHTDYVKSATDADKSLRRAFKQLRNRLLFLEHMLVSLKYRSASNQARLQNEIQLSFNIVAQSDARTSVEIGRVAQNDSAAMKTVAFLTLTFLPATFISAIFSMSFFNFDAGEGIWAVSDKIWIYWAVSIPVTCITILLWFFWHRVFPPKLVGNGGTRLMGSFPTGV